MYDVTELALIDLSDATTNASSIYNRSTPHKAIDGNNSTDFINCNCCFASNGGGKQWLLIDLQKNYDVARIDVLGRTDGKDSI